MCKYTTILVQSSQIVNKLYTKQSKNQPYRSFLGFEVEKFFI
jgi:hypothetical protein